jgi:hypothetical protein
MHPAGLWNVPFFASLSPGEEEQVNTQAIMAQMEETVRRSVPGEMRQADELAALACRPIEEMRGDLERWTAEGRMLSVELEGVEYFARFALNPADGFRPYPAVAEASRILSEVLGKNSWVVASWFIGVNSFLEDQRPADVLASDPDWVLEAAHDEVLSVKYPHG